MSTDEREYNLAVLKQHLANGANWFYWIAGLSLINLLIAIAGGKIHFIVGSSFVEVCSGVAEAAGPILKSLAFIFSFLILGFYLFLGRYANRAAKWAFIIGMVIYGIDGLVYLLVEDFLPAAFHGYVLYKLYTGMAVIPEYLALQQDIIDNPPVAETATETLPVEEPAVAIDAAPTEE
jgi:hypothetical protein